MFRLKLMFHEFFQTPLLKVLQDQLDENPSQKEKILQASKEYWQTKRLANRSFDPLQFLNLFDPDFFNALSKPYSDFLDIDKFKMTDTGVILTKENDRTKLTGWARYVIKQACANILNKNGTLNQKLIEYLQWNQYDACYTKKGIRDIVSSYVGILFLNIAEQHKEKINKIVNSSDLNSYHAIQLYISRNCSDWIQKEFDENYQSVISHDAENAAKEISTWLKSLNNLSQFELFKAIKNKLENDFLGLADNVKEQKKIFSSWFEAIVNSVSRPLLFLSTWNVFSLFFIPEWDFRKLTHYQRDQYLFCHNAAIKFSCQELLFKKYCLDHISTQAKLMKKFNNTGLLIPERKPELVVNISPKINNAEILNSNQKEPGSYVNSPGLECRIS